MKGEKGLRERPKPPWLLLPLNTLWPRARWFPVAFCTVAVLGWSSWRNGDLLFAWNLPDVKFYFHLAQGEVDLVPKPFSARPLAPLLVRGLVSSVHCTLQKGFTALAYGSLLIALTVVFFLLFRSGAPRWVVSAVAIVPFWPQLLSYAGLPDPLYTALLALLLLALQFDWVFVAAAMMFPLMLARESTSLTLLCLLLVGWRRLRWRGCLLALGSTAAGALVVHRLSAGSPPNPEQLSSGLYMLGKLVANSLRSTGLLPWSNVYPELCATPAWQAGLALGPVHAIGVCTWDRIPPSQLLWVLLTTFGLLPVIAVAGWRSWRRSWGQDGLLLPFCLLYGSVSVLLAPALGTWYARLVGYGWPLLLVAVPRLLAASGVSQGGTRAWGDSWRWGGVLLVHGMLCALGNRMGTPHAIVCAAALEVLGIALLLGHRRPSPNSPETPESAAPAW